MNRNRIWIIAGVAALGLTIPALAAAQPSGTPDDNGIPGDVRGNCDEAEHAADPECLTVGVSTPSTPSTSATSPTSPTSVTAPTSVTSPAPIEITIPNPTAPSDTTAGTVPDNSVPGNSAPDNSVSGNSGPGNSVPDGGTTAVLLGLGVLGLTMFRRKS